MRNFEPNELTPQYKASLKSRVIVGIVLAAILVPTFILGGWVFFCVIGAFLAIAIHEMSKATKRPYGWYVYVATYIIVFAFVYWFVVKGNLEDYQINPSGFVFSLEKHFHNFDISWITVVCALGFYFVVAIADENFSFGDVSYFITMTLLLGLGFQSFFFLRYYPFYLYGVNPEFANQSICLSTIGKDLVETPLFSYGASVELLFFVIIGVVLNDTIAYFVGSLFGKHHMNERVSPHKTWEGFFGGWIGSFLITSGIGLAFAASNTPMLPTLTLDQWYWIVFLAFVIPLFGDLGDLSMSFIKRYFKLKDYGTILRGHGGILDRADSAMFACIGVMVLLIFITNGWNFIARA